MKETNKEIDRIYKELIESKDFNNNYFEARINAIAIYRCWKFIKEYIKNERRQK